MFSPHDITSVRVSIDDTPLSSDVEHVDGSLYVCVWQPDLYSSGLHRITVLATVSLCDKIQYRAQLREVIKYKLTIYILNRPSGGNRTHALCNARALLCYSVKAVFH